MPTCNRSHPVSRSRQAVGSPQLSRGQPNHTVESRQGDGQLPWWYGRLPLWGDRLWSPEVERYLQTGNRLFSVGGFGSGVTSRVCVCSQRSSRGQHGTRGRVRVTWYFPYVASGGTVQLTRHPVVSTRHEQRDGHV